MIIDQTKVSIYESQSNPAAVSLRYSDCPHPPIEGSAAICAVITVGFGSILKTCVYFKHEDEDNETCLYKKKGGSMNAEAILLLFQFISMGIDSLARLTFLVEKILAMSPEELKVHTESQELRSDMLMVKIDDI